MDRNGEPSGTPDSYHGDEGMATKNQLWLQNQATRQQFQRLEARLDRKSTRLNSSHRSLSRMPSSA